MSGRRKPKKVDEVVVERLGLRTDIFLTPLNKFMAEVGNEEFVDADCEAVKAWAEKKLKEQTELVWEPKILIEHSDGEASASYHRRTLVNAPNEKRVVLDLKFERFEMATPRGKRLFRRHALDVPTDEYAVKRRASGEDLISNVYIAQEDVLMPYDQQVWDDFCALFQTIRDANARLAKLLAEPARLSAAISSVPLLGDGKPV